MHVVYEKLRLSTSISGPSLLEEMYRQHLDDMRPTVSTVDVWYTNAALPRISGLAFVTDDIAKMLKKMQRILFTMDSSG